MINLSEEFLKFTSSVDITHEFISTTHSFQRWIPPNRGFLKVKIDVSFSSGKMNVGILVRNHLGVPLLAKAIPRARHFDVD